MDEPIAQLGRATGDHVHPAQEDMGHLAVEQLEGETGHGQEGRPVDGLPERLGELPVEPSPPKSRPAWITSSPRLAAPCDPHCGQSTTGPKNTPPTSCPPAQPTTRPTPPRRSGTTNEGPGYLLVSGLFGGGFSWCGSSGGGGGWGCRAEACWSGAGRRGAPGR